MSYKPQGYTSVAPYLVVDGAARTISFLEQVFAGQTLRRFLDDEGKIMHAEVQIDDTVLMVADGNEAGGWPPLPSHVHIYVADVDGVYARALASGAESVQAPVQKDDDDRRGGVKDAGGTTWWIATKVN